MRITSRRLRGGSVIEAERPEAVPAAAEPALPPPVDWESPWATGLTVAERETLRQLCAPLVLAARKQAEIASVAALPRLPVRTVATEPERHRTGKASLMPGLARGAAVAAVAAGGVFAFHGTTQAAGPCSQPHPPTWCTSPHRDDRRDDRHDFVADHQRYFPQAPVYRPPVVTYYQQPVYVSVPYTVPVTYTAPVTYGIPTVYAAVISPTAVTFSWAPTGAAGYLMTEVTPYTQQFNLVTSSVTLVNLAPGYPVCITVASESAYGNSAPSQLACATP